MNPQISVLFRNRGDTFWTDLPVWWPADVLGSDPVREHAHISNMTGLRVAGVDVFLVARAHENTVTSGWVVVPCDSKPWPDGVPRITFPTTEAALAWAKFTIASNRSIE